VRSIFSPGNRWLFFTLHYWQKKATLKRGLLLAINKVLYWNYFINEEHKINRPTMPPRINPPKSANLVTTLNNDGTGWTSTADAFISNGFWLIIFFERICASKIICIHKLRKVVLLRNTPWYINFQGIFYAENGEKRQDNCHKDVPFHIVTFEEFWD
jgi:hypothetical protein